MITYFNILRCKMVNDMLLSFEMNPDNSTTPHISTVMIDTIKNGGYFIYEFKSYDVKIYTLSIKNGYDITNANDIPDVIKRKYSKEIRLRKINKLKQLLR